jgi:hypothetical protein
MTPSKTSPLPMPHRRTGAAVVAVNKARGRLQRQYKEAVQATFPNPQRKGCPGAEVLQNLASRSARHEDIDASTGST